MILTRIFVILWRLSALFCSSLRFSEIRDGNSFTQFLLNGVVLFYQYVMYQWKYICLGTCVWICMHVCACLQTAEPWTANTDPTNKWNSHNRDNAGFNDCSNYRSYAYIQICMYICMVVHKCIVMYAFVCTCVNMCVWYLHFACLYHSAI